MKSQAFFFFAVILLFPAASMAADLKPKYYKECVDGWSDVRERIPKPPIDIADTAKKVGKWASLAGSLGGLGNLGGSASKAFEVASYSSLIVDVLELTDTMNKTFPVASDRYEAYGDRMNKESSTLHLVADFAMNSQDCYAMAYGDLLADSGSSSREKKKRHKEILKGTEAVTVLLDHAVKYMDINIHAYNEALYTDTTNTGFNLDNMLLLAQQANLLAMKTDVISGSGGYGGVYAAGSWSPDMVLGTHQQSLLSHYSAAGFTNGAVSAGELTSSNLFDDLTTLTNIVSLSEVDPNLALNMALQYGAQELGGASSEATMAPTDSTTAASIDALQGTGGEIAPYLEVYGRTRGLSEMQSNVNKFVSTKP